MGDATAVGWPERAVRQRLWQAFGLVLLAVILAWALHSIDLKALSKALADIDMRLLVLAAGLSLVALAAQAWRWHVLLRAVGPVDYGTSLTAMILNFAVSSVVPARAGELARIRIVVRRTRLGTAAVVGTIVLDHVVNGVTAAPLALALRNGRGLPPWMIRGLVIVLAIALAGGVAAWAVAPRRHPRESGVQTFAGGLRAGFSAMTSPSQLAHASAVGVLAWAVELATTLAAMAATGLGVQPALAVIVLIAVNLALTIPAPPANLGTFEVGAVLALTATGVPKEASVAFALCYHALQLASVWVAAAVAWPFLRERKSATTA